MALFDKQRSSPDRKIFDTVIEPLLLSTEKFLLQWFGHDIRMLQKRLPKQSFLARIKEACVIDLKQDDTNEEDLTKITKARTRSQEWWRIVGAMTLS